MRSLLQKSIPSSRHARRLVSSLSLLQFLLWVGGSAVVPVLPTYLRRQGSSPALIGGIMASYFAASVLTQYPLGRLSDRIGPRVVTLVSLVVFAIGSLGFAATAGPLPAFFFRSLQGIGAGGVTVASTACVGAAVPANERGAAFSLLYGAQMLALAIGPLGGSILGASSMRLLFLVAAAAAALAAIPCAWFVPGRLALEGSRLSQRGERARLRLSPGLSGAGLIFVAVGVQTGLYEACWSLLLHLRHATMFDIGLSWTLFALPFALLSLPAGRLADRHDRRVLAIGSLLISSGFAVLYPFLHEVGLLVGLGCVEAVGAVLGTPAALSVLAGSARRDQQGEAQGAIGSAKTAATAIGASIAGVLFGWRPVAPFIVVGAVMALVAVAVMGSWWRIPGRVAEEPEEPLVGVDLARYSDGAPSEVRA